VLPTGFLPIAGGVTMTQTGAVMSINQPLARGIANWQTFSIGRGRHRQHRAAERQQRAAQPRGGPATSSRPSRALLNANGRVILVNPNGVMFSQGATVNVGGLVASTLALTTSDKSFMDGATKLTFERADANSGRRCGGTSAASPPPAAGPWC
jgi:filamentous hemagglutinin family protein